MYIVEYKFNEYEHKTYILGAYYSEFLALYDIEESKQNHLNRVHRLSKHFPHLNNPIKFK